MKYLGIDYGTKKIGIAVSDPLGTVAFPREVLVNDREVLKVLATLIETENIEGIVVGESFNLSGGLNPVAAAASQFAQKLKGLAATPLTVTYQDERFTTKQARTLPNEGAPRGNVARHRIDAPVEKQADAQAAALILQGFLDKQKN
jgi:putative Holliday junction resolvase